MRNYATSLFSSSADVVATALIFALSMGILLVILITGIQRRKLQRERDACYMVLIDQFIRKRNPLADLILAEIVRVSMTILKDDGELIKYAVAKIRDAKCYRIFTDNGIILDEYRIMIGAILNIGAQYKKEASAVESANQILITAFSAHYIDMSQGVQAHLNRASDILIQMSSMLDNLKSI
ncbi:MAG: hypothetical protein WC819_01075 [Parcubacteria group bacterium]|jgi:hypothetical protein